MMRKEWTWLPLVVLMSYLFTSQAAADDQGYEAPAAPIATKKAKPVLCPTGAVNVVLSAVKSTISPDEACPVLVTFVNTSSNNAVWIMGFPYVRRYTDCFLFVVTDEKGIQVPGAIPEPVIPMWLYGMEDGTNVTPVAPVWDLPSCGGVVRLVPDALRYCRDQLTNGTYTLTLTKMWNRIYVCDPKAVFVRPDLGPPPFLAVTNRQGAFVEVPVRPNSIKIEIVGKGHSASPDSTNRPTMTTPFADRTRQ